MVLVLVAVSNRRHSETNANEIVTHRACNLAGEQDAFSIKNV